MISLGERLNKQYFQLFAMKSARVLSISLVTTVLLFSMLLSTSAAIGTGTGTSTGTDTCEYCPNDQYRSIGGQILPTPFPGFFAILSLFGAASALAAVVYYSKGSRLFRV